MNTFTPLRIRRSARGRHPQQGSMLIEFLIVFPIVMAMLLIVADFGRLTPWAQQLAYAADAGAQFAYRRYSCDGPCNGTGYQIDDPDPNNVSSANFAEVEEAVKEHIESAVDGLVDLKDESVDIEVTEIRACPELTLSGNTVELTYDSCVDDNTRERRFIEVEVSSEFQPFTKFIKNLLDLLPEEQRTWTFKMRRQIFPAS